MSTLSLSPARIFCLLAFFFCAASWGAEQSYCLKSQWKTAPPLLAFEPKADAPSALHMILFLDDTSALRRALSAPHCLHPDSPSAGFAQSPLFYAQSASAIRILLDAGANPNFLASDGSTPLMALIRHELFAEDDPSFATQTLPAYRRRLASLGLGSSSAPSKTPIVKRAWAKERQEGAQLFLSRGADPSLSNKRGNSALGMASFLGQISVVDLLLRHERSDPMARNAFGESPLHAALFSKTIPSLERMALINMLIAKGADPFAKDKAGLTPEDYALLLGDAPIWPWRISPQANPKKLPAEHGIGHSPFMRLPASNIKDEPLF